MDMPPDNTLGTEDEGVSEQHSQDMPGEPDTATIPQTPEGGTQ